MTDKQNEYEQQLEELKPLIARALTSCTKQTNDAIAGMLAEKMFGGAGERMIVIDMCMAVDLLKRKRLELEEEVRRLRTQVDMSRVYSVEQAAREKANRDDERKNAQRVAYLEKSIDVVVRGQQERFEKLELQVVRLRDTGAYMCLSCGHWPYFHDIDTGECQKKGCECQCLTQQLREPSSGSKKPPETS
ncbi:MAG: hypothetical protein V3U34_00645 [candidate division NC10 bacterium]